MRCMKKGGKVEGGQRWKGRGWEKGEGTRVGKKGRVKCVKGERVDGRKRRKVREWEKGEVTGGGKGKCGGEEKG